MGPCLLGGSTSLGAGEVFKKLLQSTKALRLVLQWGASVFGKCIRRYMRALCKPAVLAV